MYVDPLHFTIALGPLAVYLLLLGTLNLSRRPFLTTGPRDISALGLAISGFVVAGPMELFLPEKAAVHFGGFIWVLLLGFYVLCLTLLVLLLRPRIIIYNVTADQLRPILADVVSELDPDARWAGESLILPRLSVQLHVEPFVAMRNVQLVSSGPRQSYVGWRRLENALAQALRETKSTPSPYGFSLIFFGLLMVGLITYCVVNDSQAVAQALREMLRH
jgi:hypothetical protein